MRRMQRGAAALLFGLGMLAALAMPVSAQEIPTGAGRVVEKVEFRVLVARIQLDVQIGRILENNEGAIPGK